MPQSPRPSDEYVTGLCSVSSQTPQFGCARALLRQRCERHARRHFSVARWRPGLQGRRCHRSRRRRHRRWRDFRSLGKLALREFFFAPRDCPPAPAGGRSSAPQESFWAPVLLLVLLLTGAFLGLSPLGRERESRRIFRCREGEGYWSQNRSLAGQKLRFRVLG